MRGEKKLLEIQHNILRNHSRKQDKQIDRLSKGVAAEQAKNRTAAEKYDKLLQDYNALVASKKDWSVAWRRNTKMSSTRIARTTTGSKPTPSTIPKLSSYMRPRNPSYCLRRQRRKGCPVPFLLSRTRSTSSSPKLAPFSTKRRTSRTRPTTRARQRRPPAKVGSHQGREPRPHSRQRRQGQADQTPRRDAEGTGAEPSRLRKPDRRQRRRRSPKPPPTSPMQSRNPRPSVKMVDGSNLHPLQNSDQALLKRVAAMTLGVVFWSS